MVGVCSLGAYSLGGSYLYLYLYLYFYIIFFHNQTESLAIPKWYFLVSPNSFGIAILDIAIFFGMAKIVQP